MSQPPTPPQPDQYICFLRARPTFLDDATPDESAVISRHFAYLADLTRRGSVLLAGRTLDAPPIGIVILQAPTPQDAQAIVAADPAVAAAVFTAELRPYRVALANLPPTPAPNAST